MWNTRELSDPGTGSRPILGFDPGAVIGKGVDGETATETVAPLLQTDRGGVCVSSQMPGERVRPHEALGFGNESRSHRHGGDASKIVESRMRDTVPCGTPFANKDHMIG